MACADNYFITLLAFITCTFPLRQLTISGFSGHDAIIRTEACGGILFPRLQHAYNFVCGTKVPGLVEGTQFDFALSLLALRRSGKLS